MKKQATFYLHIASGSCKHVCLRVSAQNTVAEKKVFCHLSLTGFGILLMKLCL